MVRHVAGLERLLAEHTFAVDEGPVGTAQVPQDELVSLLEELAMTAADLRRSDPDLAIVVAANAVDSIHQLQRVCPAAASHDLESIIHDLGNPDWLAERDARGDENEQEGTVISSSLQANRLASDTQMKSRPMLAVASGRSAWGIRRKRLAIRGDNSILRKSSMPGLYRARRTRFFDRCIEIRGSSSGVEHHVANVVVVGSNPISRSGVLPSGLAAFARARWVRDGGSSRPSPM